MLNLSTMMLARRQPLARVLFNHLALFSLAAAALLSSASAWADPPGRVGRVAQIYGSVWIFDAEQGEWIAAQPNLPLTAGDRLSSERDARAELQIGSATLRLDGGSELEVGELNDSQVALHLHHGSLALRLHRSESAREFVVTTAEGRFAPLGAGHYRIDQENSGSFAGALVGALHFEAADSALDIYAGQRAEFWLEQGTTHYSWSTAANDRFSNWIAQQDREEERVAPRSPYVSPEMTGAGDLDRYGEWDRHPEYGAVWYPAGVDAGWAPYRYGHWAYVQPWGWTWVDDAPWGFAPFHYGRWISWRSRWAWCPGQYVARPVYAPALVAWIGGPHLTHRHQPRRPGRGLGAAVAARGLPPQLQRDQRLHHEHQQCASALAAATATEPARAHRPDHVQQPGRAGRRDRGVAERAARAQADRQGRDHAGRPGHDPPLADDAVAASRAQQRPATWQCRTPGSASRALARDCRTGRRGAGRAARAGRRAHHAVGQGDAGVTIGGVARHYGSAG